MKRVIFLGWNDYVVGVAKTCLAGDMVMIGKMASISEKMRRFGSSHRMPAFAYIYASEYHFMEVGGKKSETKPAEPLDMDEFVSMFMKVYQQSLLCVLVMKDEMKDPIAGNLYVYLNWFVCWDHGVNRERVSIMILLVRPCHFHRQYLHSQSLSSVDSHTRGNDAFMADALFISSAR